MAAVYGRHTLKCSIMRHADSVGWSVAMTPPPERRTDPARQEADEADKGKLRQARPATLQILHLLQ
jgi:hypothetical protein